MEAGMTFHRGDYSPLVLAYLGDSFFETLARAYLIGNGDCKTSDLNQASKKIVTAAGQSRIVESILPLLNEEETAIFKSGRNAKSAHHSKSASILDYRRATGLECLYGYFWISGQTERAKELFELSMKGVNDDGGIE